MDTSNNIKGYENFENRIREIIFEFYEGDLDFNESFEEAGINSVTFVKIAVTIENEYNIEFKDEDFEEDRFANIKEFFQYVFQLWNDAEASQ